MSNIFTVESDFYYVQDGLPGIQGDHKSSFHGKNISYLPYYLMANNIDTSLEVFN